MADEAAATGRKVIAPYYFRDVLTEIAALLGDRAEAR